MRGSRSVVRQLVLVTSVVGLLTGAVGLGVVRSLERSVAVDGAAGAATASAQRTATTVDGRVGALLAQLSLFATRQELRDLDDEAAGELAVALPLAGPLEALSLHDADGVPLAGVGPGGSLAPAAVAAVRDGPSVRAGTDARIQRADDVVVLELVAAVADGGGELLGYVVGRTPLQRVAAEVLTPTRSGGRTIVVDHEGRVLADRDPARVSGGEVVDLEPFARGEDAVERREDGAQLVVAAAPLEAVTATVLVEQVVTDPGPGLRGPTGVLLLVVLAIVLAVIATGRRLLRPLGPLAEGVSRLAEGERGVRVDETGRGEVAAVAHGFNRMAAALERRREELESAERAARVSEERLRLVVEGVEGYAIVLLDVLGDVQTWNAGAERVTGRRADEAVGRRLTDLASGPLHDPVVDATRTGRGAVAGWFDRPDGSRFWGELRVTALRRDDGAPSGYAAILQDDSERRAAREALEDALRRERDAAAELRRANELKDEFLAVAAHEIRTPLAAVLGASHLLAPGPDPLDPAEIEEVRRIIWHHASDLQGIVERLLDYTRLQADRIQLEPRPLRLDEELERVVRTLAPHLAEHEVVLEVDPVEVILDLKLLEQVSSNLVSNAAKFAPAGTRITVAAGVREGWLEVAVSDQGPGIDPDDQERIFELFRQSTRTDASARGVGVGLTIVRRYVDLAGGEVTVDSAPGEGATFRVRIPVRVPS
jgi:PAS domain S-box-containing protein